MRYALLVVLLILCGCESAPTVIQQPPPPAAVNADPAPAPAPLPAPTSTPWALKPGWQHYRIGRGRAKLNPVTGWLEIDMASIQWGETNRNTNLPYQNAYGAGVARVYSPGGVEVAAVPDKLGASLLYRFDSTQTYIGEAGSYLGPDCNEPEPLCPVDPFPGQVIKVVSDVEAWNGDRGKFESECRVLAGGIAYDGFPDCVVTLTTENPQLELPQRTVFLNVFSGGELAVQVKGEGLTADGSCSVIYAKRVAMG